MTEAARASKVELASVSLEEALEFGPFRLLTRKRILLEAGRPQRLGGRAMDLLILLASRAGELLTKEELLAHAWPQISVEESSLRVHIAALRRTLRDGQNGARYIVNVSGRGYCFTTAVAATRDASPPDADTPGPRPANLPSRLSRTVGRAEVVRSVAAQLQNHRFVTITGFGGVGKTTVAIAVAETMAGWYADGVCFVDFAAISAPAMAASTLGTALGLSVPMEDAIPVLTRFLTQRQTLLVLDNCEHLADKLAGLIEAILKAAPRVHVLATSREPLRADGERLQHLTPLDLPSPYLELTAETAMSFSAVQLFVEHACASQDSFQLSDTDAAVAGEICRRLDGIPLAIELAANRVDLFGIRGLARRLDDRFLLITEGRRTALPRHRTLRAMLDWSYELLAPAHQAIFRRLAIFRGAFTLEGAIAVARGDDLTEHDVVEAIGVLTAGSLLATDVSEDVAFHSLLGVTRAYARIKLDEHEAVGVLRRAHAQHLLDMFKVAQAEWLTRDRTEWLAVYGRTIEDLRAALDWSFGPDGDAALGVALTAAWMPLGSSMSLFDEFVVRVATAIQWLDVVKLDDPKVEMQLRSNIGVMQGQTRGAIDGIEQEAERVIQMAEASGDPILVHDALLGLWAAAFGAGKYRVACPYTERMKRSAIQHDDPVARLTAERMTAQNLHFLGDHGSARLTAVQVMNAAGSFRRLPLASPAQVDRRVSMRIIEARCLFIEGRPDEARQIAAESVAFARGDLVHALSQAIGMAALPIAIWRGDHEEAAELASLLLSHSDQFAMGYWSSWACHYAAVLERRGVDSAPGLSTGDLDPPGSKLLDHLITCDPGVVTGHALERVRQGEVGWNAPEILRAHGEILLAHGTAEARRRARGLFLEAVRLSADQKAWSWELRAAHSLARMADDADRQEAADRLDEVLSRGPESSTRDIVAARALLQTMG